MEEKWYLLERVKIGKCSYIDAILKAHDILNNRGIWPDYMTTEDTQWLQHHRAMAYGTRDGSTALPPGMPKVPKGPAPGSTQHAGRAAGIIPVAVPEPTPPPPPTPTSR